MSIKLIFIALPIILTFNACNSNSKPNKVINSNPTVTPTTLPGDANTTVIPTTPPGDTNHTVIPTILLKNKKYISLTTGIKQKLLFPNNKDIEWDSNNSAITIDNDGVIYANKDISHNNAQATITATPKNGDTPLSIEVTAVPWRANLSSLTIEHLPLNISSLLAHKNSNIYYTYGSSVYSSSNSMNSSKEIGDFFTENYSGGRKPYHIETPSRHYIRIGNEIHMTTDFSTYDEILTSPLSHATKLGGLKSAFAYDKKNNYIYAGEYSVNEHNNTHSVYRGKANETGIENWSEVLTFDSRIQDTIKTVRHIHVVAVDPYTSNVWISTGDTNRESRLYYSQDQGKSFKLFAIGSQYYRSLSIWFTKDYMYWNTDSASVKQVISRVKRTDISKGILTPKLSSGETKIGVSYYVLKSTDGFFPKKVGRIYKETSTRELSEENIVYAIDDPIYDYREIVTELANSAHWYHLIVKNKKEEEIVLMSTSAEISENFSRDNHPRIFGIKERKDGTVDIQELLSIENDNKEYTQFIPYFQDEKGFIYFKGRDTKTSAFKTKLQWIDQ